MKAFSFVEILVAVFLLVVLVSPLLWMATGSRVETSKAINYLRALEIAQETISWVNGNPLNEKAIQALAAQSGSLVDPATGKSVAVMAGNSPIWSSFPGGGSPITYSDQYTNAYFYRKVDIEKVGADESAYGEYLYRVTVNVYWNEGKVPVRIDAPDAEADRMRKISISTMVFDERRPY